MKGRTAHLVSLQDVQLGEQPTQFDNRLARQFLTECTAKHNAPLRRLAGRNLNIIPAQHADANGRRLQQKAGDDNFGNNFRFGPIRFAVFGKQKSSHLTFKPEGKTQPISQQYLSLTAHDDLVTALTISFRSAAPAPSQQPEAQETAA